MDLTKQTATALCRSIQEGELSAEEVLEAHLQEADRWHPHINALLAQNRDNARAQARQADQDRKAGKIQGPSTAYS